MASNIFIRPASKEDARAVAEVQVSAWRVAYRCMMPDQVLDEMNTDARTGRWEEIIAQSASTTLVAETGGAVIGWIRFGASRDGDAPPQTGEVYGLYVSPGHWRLGAGRQLWQAACDRLRHDGFHSADVWVLEANTRARRFYESTGAALDPSAAKMFGDGSFESPEVRYRLGLHI